jgi:hypothetical protein
MNDTRSFNVIVPLSDRTNFSTANPVLLVFAGPGPASLDEEKNFSVRGDHIGRSRPVVHVEPGAQSQDPPWHLVFESVPNRLPRGITCPRQEL